MPMASETTNHLDLTLMVAFHDAFRRDLAHLARTASRRPAQLDQPNRRTAVLAGWELFKTQLHIHHTAEDHDLWPRMRTHLADRPDELALLQAMQDEHAHIDPLLAAVEDALADRDGGHQRLGDTVDALASALYGHLGHEEREVLPLIDQSLTPAEWRAFGNDQRRRTGIRGAAQFLPWVLDEASPEQVRAVLGGSRRRCGWSTGGSGSPATPATTTGSHQRSHEPPAPRGVKNQARTDERRRY
jgi:iron-sulfur cluster repair protein YtfE (RIC family)